MPKKTTKNKKNKSQESSEAKAKSQMGMQIGSKLQQIAPKSEILAPKCSKYKPEARNRRSQKPKAFLKCPGFQGTTTWKELNLNVIKGMHILTHERDPCT